MNPGSRDRYIRSVEEWKDRLTTEQFRILRQNGTEPPFKNQYWDNEEVGTYVCAGCGNVLFRSESKYDSGTGWPSFSAPSSDDAVETIMEIRLSKRRIAVSCARCRSHLGHVYSDGPPPTGLRYCINSGAMIFFKDMNTPSKERAR